jgi:hypothetical protein
MTLVELVDAHQGFYFVSRLIKTDKVIKLLWIAGLITFFMSAVLDNLTTAIVMVTLLRKLISNKETRKYFVGIVVIAANAGGAWSPIGDVTTTMLWIGGQISAGSIKPYQLFLIFNELVDGMDAKGMIHAKDLGWMIDASHNVKDPLEDLLQSVEAIQIAYAQALLVDRAALEAAREANDVVRCQEILQAVFRTDVRALVAQARLELGGALDPIALFRQEKMRGQLIVARGAKTVATGL